MFSHNWQFVANIQVIPLCVEGYTLIELVLVIQVDNNFLDWWLHDSWVMILHPQFLVLIIVIMILLTEL